MTTRTSPEISPERLYSPSERQTGFRIEFEVDETPLETAPELSETYLYVIVDDRYFACDAADNLMLEAYELIPNDEAQAEAIAELLATEEPQTIEILYETTDQGEIWSIQTYVIAGINELGQPLFTISSSSELRTPKEIDDTNIEDDNNETSDDMTDDWLPGIETLPETTVEPSSELTQAPDEPVQTADISNEATVIDAVPKPHINIEHSPITVIKPDHTIDLPPVEITTEQRSREPVIESPDNNSSATPEPIKEIMPRVLPNDAPEQINQIPPETPLSSNIDPPIEGVAVDTAGESTIEYMAPADDDPVAVSDIVVTTDYSRFVITEATEMANDSAESAPDISSELVPTIKTSAADTLATANQQLEDVSNIATTMHHQTIKSRSEYIAPPTEPIVLPQDEIIPIHTKIASKVHPTIEPPQIAMKPAIHHKVRLIEAKPEPAHTNIPPIVISKKTLSSKQQRYSYAPAPIIKTAKVNVTAHDTDNKVTVSRTARQTEKLPQTVPKSFDQLRPRSQPYSTVLSADIASTDDGNDDLVITLRPTAKMTKTLQLSVEAAV